MIRSDGTWYTTQWGGVGGRWKYAGGVVTVSDPMDLGSADQQQDSLTVSEVPGEIAPDLGKTFPLVAGWAEVGGEGDLDVQVTGQTVRLSFGGGKRVITCTRA
ncbi:hypothetical protein ACFVVX_20210 [Kitasatospora sp. NPDC058170]|uniref:hypothetical protein n=1 Tax=Kitasatospora sp. NPDC058170 TaxID=3346364 RepID=UPI0036D8B790